MEDETSLAPNQWSKTRDKGLHGLPPRDNAPEAAVCDDVEVIGIGTLAKAVGFLMERLPLEPTCLDINEVFGQASIYDIDFAEVRGQESAKRALTIAAAGAHNVLTIGPSTRCAHNESTRNMLWVKLPISHSRRAPSGRQPEQAQCAGVGVAGRTGSAPVNLPPAG